MTIDVKIRWDTDIGTGDFLFVDNDLDTDEGLATAVIISLFTDQRASDEDPIPNSGSDQTDQDRRGWWGDLASPEANGDEIGSKLWLLERGYLNQEDLTKAEIYATDALNWLVEEGIAKDIIATAEKSAIDGANFMTLSVEITKVDGSKKNYTFDAEWAATLEED